jgi:acetyl esterase/lipase
MKKIIAAVLIILAIAGASAYVYVHHRENPMDIHVTIPPKTLPPTISIVQGIPYAGTSDTEQTLDLYTPAAVNFPTVVFIHGGSWTNGSKEMYAGVGTYFQARGIGCAVINYRLSPKVVHPAHTQDAAAAVAWIHDNIATYGGNPKKVFLTGHSAGGHIASLVATDEKFLAPYNLTPKDISGVVSISGIYLINYNVNFYGVGHVFKGSNKADASPINHVHPGLPPWLLFVAEADVPTFDKQARNFQAVLQKSRNDSKLILYKGQDHATIIVSMFTPNNPHESDLINFIKSH